MTDKVSIPPLTLELPDNNFTEDELKAAVNTALNKNDQFVTALRSAHKHSKTAEVVTHKQFPMNG